MGLDINAAIISDLRARRLWPEEGQPVRAVSIEYSLSRRSRFRPAEVSAFMRWLAGSKEHRHTVIWDDARERYLGPSPDGGGGTLPAAGLSPSTTPSLNWQIMAYLQSMDVLRDGDASTFAAVEIENYLRESLPEDFVLGFMSWLAGQTAYRDRVAGASDYWGQHSDEKLTPRYRIVRWLWDRLTSPGNGPQGTNGHTLFDVYIHEAAAGAQRQLVEVANNLLTHVAQQGLRLGADFMVGGEGTSDIEVFVSALWKALDQDSAFAHYIQSFESREEGEVAGSLLLHEAALAVYGLGYLKTVRASVQPLNTPYLNTIDVVDQIPFGGSADEEAGVLGKYQVVENYVRWNAALIVDQANRLYKGLGGHMATFQSQATLMEVAQNFFIRGEDQVFFQGHASPGMYARAFLEGRLSLKDLEHFRREAGKRGLSSYPHPWLMPDFWQFATVSMGLGPLASIYQAYFNLYLKNRGIFKDGEKAGRVWAFLGDGEMDEPEARGALHVAGNEKLDIIHVVNCNLQSLDRPVRGNASVIQELEREYIAAGWTVIKVIWGDLWDPIFRRAQETGKFNALMQKLGTLTDGQWQSYAVWDGEKVADHFFRGADGETDEGLVNLFGPDIKARGVVDPEKVKALFDNRGGHSPRKVYAAYQRAMELKGPVALLFQTIKGRDLEGFQGLMSTHNQKAFGWYGQIIALKEKLGIAIEIPDVPEAQRAGMKPKGLEVARQQLLHEWNPFVQLPDGPFKNFLLAQREKLGGFVPKRNLEVKPEHRLTVPEEGELVRILVGENASKPTKDFIPLFLEFLKGNKPELQNAAGATTKTMVALLGKLVRYQNATFGRYLLPIIPDEGRTFGMDVLMSKLGIYETVPRRFVPADVGQGSEYKAGPTGQIVETGIAEANANALFLAAATSHSTHGIPTIPMYFFYSMFGLQRTADQWWQIGDMRGRGIMYGCTFGRTTLNGEGLQHEDGHSLLFASVIPNLVAYEVAFDYELAVLHEEALRRMHGEGEDVFYYFTLHNEASLMPPVLLSPEVREGIIKGMYRFVRGAEIYPDVARDSGSSFKGVPTVDLLASGTLVKDALLAQEFLAQHGILADISSVTSYSELRRDALRVERENRQFHGQGRTREIPYVQKILAESNADAVVAVTDSMKAVADQIARWVPDSDRRFVSLGTDGFGRSDTRAELRNWFENNFQYMAYVSAYKLHQGGRISLQKFQAIKEALKIDPYKPDPATYDVLSRREREATFNKVKSVLERKHGYTEITGDHRSVTARKSGEEVVIDVDQASLFIRPKAGSGSSADLMTQDWTAEWREVAAEMTAQEMARAAEATTPPKPKEFQRALDFLRALDPTQGGDAGLSFFAASNPVGTLDRLKKIIEHGVDGQLKEGDQEVGEALFILKRLIPLLSEGLKEVFGSVRESLWKLMPPVPDDLMGVLELALGGWAAKRRQYLENGVIQFQFEGRIGKGTYEKIMSVIEMDNGRVVLHLSPAGARQNWVTEQDFERDVVTRLLWQIPRLKTIFWEANGQVKKRWDLDELRRGGGPGTATPSPAEAPGAGPGTTAPVGTAGASSLRRTRSELTRAGLSLPRLSSQRTLGSHEFTREIPASARMTDKSRPVHDAGVRNDERNHRRLALARRRHMRYRVAQAARHSARALRLAARL